jgi:hypothetical protein
VIYRVTIPANSGASINFPLSGGKKTFLAGKIMPETIDIASGTYEFEIK